MLNYNLAKEHFEKYLDSYDRTDDKINLKIVHTYGVAPIITELAKRMHLSAEDTALASPK